MRARNTSLAALALLLGSACLACKASEDGAPPQVGSNSNWLRACTGVVDCSAENLPECACGVCTVECTGDQDCTGIEDARCALDTDSAARSACGAAQSMSIGICLPRCEPGSCGDEQACVNEACVLAALPDNALCNAVLPNTDAERAQQDELLALAQAHRTAGDLSCGSQAAVAQLELRLSPSLSCAARVLAADMERSRELGTIDSEGRDTAERLQLAGFQAQRWGEAFALEASSAEHALELMLLEPFNCDVLASADFSDVGIGVAGDAYVMVIARP